MSTNPDLLARTKPLADPLRIIAILFFIGAPVIAIRCWQTQGGWGATAMACSLLSFALLIAPSGKTNAIYLRAFRTDKSTARVRAELAGILGPEFRLSGIRPPKEKSSVFLRYFLPSLVALKYAGSKFMELEAGDDWMARLWKTYQTTRLVLIDVRDVTPYVHEEIELTLQSVGTSRCIFIVDERKTESEWRQLLAGIVGPESEQAQLQLLDVSPGRVASGQLDSDFKEILTRLPAGVPGDLEPGRKFVLDHVSEELIKKSRRISVMTIFSIAAGLVSALAFGLLVRLLPIKAGIFAIAFGFGFILVALISGTSRAVARAVRLKRAGYGHAAMRAWGVVVLAVLFFVANPVFSAIEFGKRAAPIKAEADEIAAIQSLHTLTTAELMYASTYPSIGYACTLSALGSKAGSADATADAAQLIDDDLTSGKRFGYTFTISNCGKTAEKGHATYTSYRITAVPSTPGQSGARGLCADENGVIRFDPNGGTDCTEELR
jgi:type IV pilus assembly protein PilA